MYRVINKYADRVINSFKYEDDIEPYIEIMKSYAEKKIDYHFMAVFKQYYRLNAARLSESFLKEYFEILKGNSSESVYEIANRLEKVTCNSINSRRVHFSFSTKLKHTMDKNSPIYDSMIAAFYFLPSIKPEWDKEQKLISYRMSYEFLEYEYKRVSENSLMKEVLNKFDQEIMNADKISNTKKIDFILWKYVSLLKSGKIRDREIEYG